MHVFTCSLFPHIWWNLVKRFCSDIMCAGWFCAHPSSETPRVIDVVAIDSGIGGPQALRNNETTKELPQHLHSWIFCMCHSPSLLKPSVLFVNVQKGNVIHDQFLVMFNGFCFTGENGTNYPPLWDSTPYSDFLSFMEDMCVLTTPYSAVLTINIST